MESILTSIKKLLGIADEYTNFDADLVMYINSAISILGQLISGPISGFTITGKTETWADFIGTDSRLELVKPYVYLKVRVLFDPPSTAALLDSMNKMITEYEWRIAATTDSEISETTST